MRPYLIKRTIYVQTLPLGPINIGLVRNAKSEVFGICQTATREELEYGSKAAGVMSPNGFPLLRRSSQLIATSRQPLVWVREHFYIYTRWQIARATFPISKRSASLFGMFPITGSSEIPTFSFYTP